MRVIQNENNKSKHSLRSNIKGYGGKTHYADSQKSNTTAPSGRELYHLQFSLQAVSPETFGYTLVSLSYGKERCENSFKPNRNYVILMTSGYLSEYRLNSLKI
jgi:hypothetical protein